MYDLILKNAHIIDYPNQINGKYDIAIESGKIKCIEKSINSRAITIKDLKGKMLLPGIVDTHVHVSTWLGNKEGHKMLIKSGVTTAFDFAGPVETVLKLAKENGLGLNLACINYIRPGHTVTNSDPDYDELESFLLESLKKGAVGYKILGGHYPLSKKAIRKSIEIANKHKAYVASHAGSIKEKSNFNGFKELVNLSKGLNIHIAHVNSYCRGDIYSADKEARKVISLLKDNKNIISESYLSAYNGTSSNCDKDNIPESMVTRSCLSRKGYEESEEGLLESIKDGYCYVNASINGENILLTKEEAVEYWNKNDRKTTISFPVNPAVSRFLLACSKDDNDNFIIDAFSSDGGGIPRNEILYQGLNMVKFNAIDMFDFVRKASYTPAKMMGLIDKGEIKVGKDADLIVIDYESNKVIDTIISGEFVMENRQINPQECKIITTEIGREYVENYGLETIIVDIGKDSLLYNKK